MSNAQACRALSGVGWIIRIRPISAFSAFYQRQCVFSLIPESALAFIIKVGVDIWHGWAILRWKSTSLSAGWFLYCMKEGPLSEWLLSFLPKKVAWKFDAWGSGVPLITSILVCHNLVGVVIVCK